MDEPTEGGVGVTAIQILPVRTGDEARRGEIYTARRLTSLPRSFVQTEGQDACRYEVMPNVVEDPYTRWYT